MSDHSPSSPLRVSLVSLGCAKNLVDSEKMLGLLAEAGLALVGSDDPADAAIINTCGFIADAREEARDNIEFALEKKQAGAVGAVIVAGCLAQHWGERLLREFPGIDAVVGLADRDQIACIVKKAAGRSHGDRELQVIIQRSDFQQQVLNDRVRLRITEPCWSYLRISEGCDRRCTFCTIPSIRGPFRSKPLEAVFEEARELIGDGAVELNLIGQETSSYGSDLGYEYGLAGLLEQLNGIDALRWIRVLYAHPATFSDRVIAAFTDCPKVVPYLDMPLQHINDRILRRMNRRIDRAATETLLKKLRDRIDKLSIRTTMLVGFPTETGAEFDELLDFVRRQRFEALGGFAYSAEEGTPAARIEPQVPDEIKQQRLDRLMQLQQEIAFEHADSLTGQCFDCLLTGRLEPEEASAMALTPGQQWLIGRLPGQAPEIDSECFITLESGAPAPIDAIVPVKITGRRDYDLVATIEMENR